MSQINEGSRICTANVAQRFTVSFSIKKHTVMPAGPSRPPATRRDTFTSQRFNRCQLESGHKEQSTSLSVSYFLISTCVSSLSHGIKNGTFCAHLPDEREDGAHFPSLLTVGSSPWFVLLKRSELRAQTALVSGWTRAHTEGMEKPAAAGPKQWDCPRATVLLHELASCHRRR